MDWAKLADSVIKAGVSTFGRAVNYLPQNNEPFEIRAIFDEAHVVSDPNSGVQIDTTTPVIHLRLADLPCPPSPGDRVCIGDDFFRVTSHQPDGQGATTLFLHKL